LLLIIIIIIIICYYLLLIRYSYLFFHFIHYFVIFQILQIFSLFIKKKKSYDATATHSSPKDPIFSPSLRSKFDGGFESGRESEN